MFHYWFVVQLMLYDGSVKWDGISLVCFQLKEFSYGVCYQVGAVCSVHNADSTRQDGSAIF